MNRFIKIINAMKFSFSNKCAVWIGLLSVLNITVIGLHFLGKGGHRPPLPERVAAEWKDKLRLDSREEALFTAEYQQHQKGHKMQLGLMSTNRKKQIAIVRTNPEDTVALQAVLAESARLHFGLDTALQHHFLRLKQICNPEQRSVFDSLFEQGLSNMPPPLRRGRN